MKKAAPYVLLILAAVVAIFLKKCKGTGNGSKSKSDYSNNSRNEVNRDRGFDRRTTYLEYTQHAKCRMDCRHITQAEVEDIMKNGDINYRKSDVHAVPCPTYALEGMEQGEKLRIVFAQCDNTTKVVTVIDMSKEWQCDCPGDDDKYKNRN